MSKSMITGWILMSLFLFGCKEESLEPQGPEYGVGTVQDFNMTPNTQVALYKKEDLDTKKKIELTYGAMDTYFVTLDGIEYMTDWNDIPDFKKLKRGDQIHFHATGYIARVQKLNTSVRVVQLNEY